MIARVRRRWILGCIAGGLATWVLPPMPAGGWEAAFPVKTLGGAIAGAVFAIAVGRRPLSPGSGLVWAFGLGLLGWLTWVAEATARNAPAATMLAVASAGFPLLAGTLIWCIPVGLTVGSVRCEGAGNAERRFDPVRAVVAGGFAGIFGGWAFGRWMEQAGFFPLVAGLMHSDSRAVGVLLHFIIAVVIGATFGLLFQDSVRGYGSSLVWGAAYGIGWWFLGPLTLLPGLRGEPVDWTAAHAAALFGSLVGHIVYGLIVGLLYAFVDGAWVWLFERTDPINRAAEGTGKLLFSSLGQGALASLLGGLLFGAVMLATGTLPRVAQIVGAHSPASGFVVHMVIGLLIGASYGILFRYEVTDGVAALAWGAAYGLIWWFLGPLTLFPILLGGTFTWTTAAANAQLASLVGHLVYGVALGAVFRRLEARHLGRLFVDARLERRWKRRRRPAGTPAPALWFFFLGTGIALPILLAGVRPSLTPESAPRGYIPPTTANATISLRSR